jgi:hypothetical protein
MVAGFFGELYAPSHIIVSGDAEATARNIVAFNSLFRAGFAAYLVEAVCDISLSLVMYELLKTVRKDLALLAAFFGLVSTAVFAVAELFYFGSSLIVRAAGHPSGFSPDQLNSLALLSLRMYGLGGGIFMVFYGLATLIRGYLIYRSGYLPKALGALLVLAGLGFIVSNFVQVLSPAYASDVLLLPMFLAALATAVWLLVKGVDVEKWEARATSVA